MRAGAFYFYETRGAIEAGLEPEADRARAGVQGVRNSDALRAAAAAVQPRATAVTQPGAVRRVPGAACGAALGGPAARAAHDRGQAAAGLPAGRREPGGASVLVNIGAGHALQPAWRCIAAAAGCVSALL